MGLDTPFKFVKTAQERITVWNDEVHVNEQESQDTSMRMSERDDDNSHDNSMSKINQARQSI